MQYMVNLSIIIPCYQDKNIYKCLESLLKNNLQEIKIEIILVTLNSVRINTEKIPDKNQIIKIEKTDINHPSLMRNLGSRVARGEFLVFLDDDVIAPPEWLETCYRLLQKNPNNVICGPNIDSGQDFGHYIANTVQALYISEGLKTHIIDEQKEVDLHNIPLNNCAMNKKIFEKIGGFNEKVDYYLDDIEFFYICSKLGYKFIQYPELVIQHRCRKFPIDFLKYKFRARKKIGYNAFFFPELYKENPIIKLVIASYFIIPFLIYWLIFSPKLFFLMVVLYFSIITLFSLKTMVKKLRYAAIIPPAIFITHLINYCGFTFGLLKGLAAFRKYKEMARIKKERYAIFLNKNY